MATSVIMMELLGRGVHANPRRGCNVLEYASVLADERWSSRPRSGHPALADVADMVNDQMTDGNRRLLVPLAPWLLGTRTVDPRAWPGPANRVSHDWRRTWIPRGTGWLKRVGRPMGDGGHPGRTAGSGDGPGMPSARHCGRWPLRRTRMMPIPGCAKYCSTASTRADGWPAKRLWIPGCRWRTVHSTWRSSGT
jgi:hypothetical protein